MLLPYGHQFVGHPCRCETRQGVSALPPFRKSKFRHPPQVARLPEMLLVLFRKDVPEVGAFQFRLPADAVNAQTSTSSVRRGS